MQDYILIQSNYLKGARRTTIGRNVDATAWGGEADAVYVLLPQVGVSGTLAYTQGHDATHDAPLAQRCRRSRRDSDWTTCQATGRRGALVRSVVEHLCRGGAMASGYGQTTKVNAPGRTLSIKLDQNF